MPIGSKQGACSSNTQTAKANCLKHNRREQVPGYVNPSLSHLNRIVFEDEMISGRKSITPLIHKAEKLYTEKVGQKVQKSFAPFRESCLVVKPDTTDKQLMQFVRDAEKLLGWKCIGVYMHLDEGHSHSKYIEGDDQWHVNAHAHVLWSCQDQNTGKILRPTRDYYRKMQDLLAAATGMERGNKASETGIRHRSALQQRILAQEGELERLQAECKKTENTAWQWLDEADESYKEVERLREQCSALKIEVEEWQDKKRNETEELNDVKTKRTQVQEEYFSLIRKNAEEKEKFERLKREVERLAEDNEAVRRDIVRAEQEKAATEAKIEAYRAQMPADYGKAVEYAERKTQGWRNAILSSMPESFTQALNIWKSTIMFGSQAVKRFSSKDAQVLSQALGKGTIEQRMYQAQFMMKLVHAELPNINMDDLTIRLLRQQLESIAKEGYDSTQSLSRGVHR